MTVSFPWSLICLTSGGVVTLPIVSKITLNKTGMSYVPQILPYVNSINDSSPFPIQSLIMPKPPSFPQSPAKTASFYPPAFYPPPGTSMRPRGPLSRKLFSIGLDTFVEGLIKKRTVGQPVLLVLSGWRRQSGNRGESVLRLSPEDAVTTARSLAGGGST